MTISWNESLAMGLPVIDVQHKRFVELLAKLEGAIDTRNESTHLIDVFDELALYVRYHFSEEEQRFNEFMCYEHAQEHRAVHEAFTKHVQELRYQFLDDSFHGAQALAKTMFDWLREHIAKMDREYEACFRAHGMGGSTLPKA
ncbi:MAG: hemerythrin family protein [Candidatus Pacebacteria bacterium]|nr:hemerythrin family protein [Candidatus Paceibacterota bacterium]